MTGRGTFDGSTACPANGGRQLGTREKKRAAFSMVCPASPLSLESSAATKIGRKSRCLPALSRHSSLRPSWSPSRERGTFLPWSSRTFFHPFAPIFEAACGGMTFHPLTLSILAVGTLRAAACFVGWLGNLLRVTGFAPIWRPLLPAAFALASAGLKNKKNRHEAGWKRKGDSVTGPLDAECGTDGSE